VRTQPFRILVASAGEADSLGAIRLATTLARRRSASVHALIVATPFPHSFPSIAAIAPPAMVDDGNRRHALEVLRHQLSTVRGTGEWAIRAATGFPADSIKDAATRWPASLIVMGTGEHGLAGRLFGSATTVKVAMLSTVPVLAVPRKARELPTEAVAAIDFSASSVAAARMAATLLGPNGTLTLLYASSLITEEAAIGTLPALYTAGARDRLAVIAEDIGRRANRKVVAAVASGSIVDRLFDRVESNQCDLIALGAHEPTLLERLLVGKVRAKVLRAAPCAVLVMPPTPEE
jgi:nucleotide-binding universal stress UspA family protein